MYKICIAVLRRSLSIVRRKVILLTFKIEATGEQWAEVTMVMVVS
jgi:hypothetical protein